MAGRAPWREKKSNKEGYVCKRNYSLALDRPQHNLRRIYREQICLQNNEAQVWSRGHKAKSVDKGSGVQN